MKKHLFYMAALAALLSFAFEAQAQSPIIASQILPKVGNKKVVYIAQGAGVSQGNAGENQVWDFSSLIPEAGSDSVTYTYFKPSNTPFGADFPNANVAVREGNGAYEYYNTADGNLELLGVRFPDKGDTFAVTYTSPVVWFTTPITYNYMNSHTYRSVTEDFGNTISSNGVVITKADAYGSVKMPGGKTYDNVLRIHISTTQTDSVKSDFGDEVNKQESNFYFFIQAGDSQELVLISTIKETLENGSVRNTKAVHYTRKTIVTGLEAQDFAANNVFSLYPNPSSARNIIVLIAEPQAGASVINVYNQLGQVVKRFNNINNSVSNNNNISLNLEGLQSGIYFIQLQNAKGSAVKKLVLE